MDAFAITGVSRGRQWFRVEAVVGGDDTPARIFPGVHVLSAEEVADRAAGGRRLYFRIAPDAPLAPLPAGGFHPAQVPGEDLPRFAFLEQASDDDVDVLLAVRMRQDLAQFGLRLKRLEALDWIARGADGAVGVTDLGLELLRCWYAAPPAQATRADGGSALRRAA